MNEEQRSKLVNALLEEASTCYDRGDLDDCMDLQIQSTRIRFHEEIKRIKEGDKKLLDEFVAMQHSKNQDSNLVARYLISALMEDAEFLKMYKPTFHTIDEEEN